VALLSGAAYGENGSVFAGMGTDFADYNNDGWPDIFVNALGNQKYALFRNNKGVFEDVTDSSGVGAITLLHSGWGARMVDYDNDGWLDLFIAQGHVMDNIELTDPSLRYLEGMLIMKNTEGKFRDVSSQSGVALVVPRAARGAAFGDLDNDGFIDVAVNCNDGHAVILRNQGNGNHWLSIRLVGSTSNRDGIGSRIRLVTEEGLELFSYVSTSGSYLSASDKRLILGWGRRRRLGWWRLPGRAGLCKRWSRSWLTRSLPFTNRPHESGLRCGMG